MATIIVGLSSSKCSECRRGVGPYEPNHHTVIGYMGSSDGCGAVFTHIDTGYLDLRDRVKSMRPDLIPAWEDYNE